VNDNQQLKRRFPAEFLWGASTSAYQIEGAASEDGRGPSIWDTLSERPGAIADGSSGAVAIDHYHRVSDDLDLLPRLGMNAYRFSLAWPRFMPQGSGPLNPHAVAFYDRMFDELLEREITPFPTLYHWDLPQPLEDAGGWPSRDTALRFADYAAAVHARLGDRAPFWTTLNEPWCSAFLGYASGEHAPGRTDPAASVRASHHLLLAHGLAASAIRANDADAAIAIAVNLYDVAPASDASADVDAARRIDGLQNRWFLDPLYRGGYPRDVIEDLAPITDLSFLQPSDLELISTPLDALCVNFYSSFCARGTGAPLAPPVGSRPTPWVGTEDVDLIDRGLRRTHMGWDIDAPALTSVLTRLHEEYGARNIYITENGAGGPDVVEDGRVHDAYRWSYIRGHIEACAEALDRGVDLRGYLMWSLLDNFEWAWGYTERFGLVHVDLNTQVRTLKESALAFADFLRQDGS